MKFNIFYDIKGGSGKVLQNVPNKENPVEAKSMKDCLARIADGLPENGIVDIIKITVSQIDETPNPFLGEQR